MARLVRYVHVLCISLCVVILTEAIIDTKEVSSADDGEDDNDDNDDDDDTIHSHVDYSFKSGDLRFMLVSQHAEFRFDAGAFCADKLNGRLAIIRSAEALQEVNTGLVVYLRKKAAAYTEIWVAGNTDTPAHGYINMTTYDWEKKGDQCLILSDWHGHEGHTRLFSKACHSVRRAFLCEIYDVPVFRYYYGQRAGGCPEATKMATAYLQMTAANCTSLGGAYRGTTLPHHVINCHFDLCGTDSAEFSGIVAAVPGRCGGDGDGVAASVRAYAAYCTALGGIAEKKVSKWKWTHCRLDWCQRSQLNRDTYAISAPQRCDTKVGEANLYMSAADCKRVGGAMTGSPEPWAWVGCTVEFCRLGQGTDCKTTTLGKEYTGTLATTANGRKCQRWDSQSPHPHANTNADWFPDETTSDAADYCRNPADWAEGPFCFTTDPNVQWEICEIPFCKGYGAKPIRFRIDSTRYVFVPALHMNPDDYCSATHGSELAHIDDMAHLRTLSAQLKRVIAAHALSKVHEVWVGGRTRADVGTRLTTFDGVFREGGAWKCLMLSDWNATENSYTNSEFNIFAQICPRFSRYFLCSALDVRIPGLSIDGGTVQPDIDDIDACWEACRDGCKSADYNTHLRRCSFYYNNSCQMGHSALGNVHLQKSYCHCNRLLVSGSSRIADSAFSASSVSEANQIIASARLDSQPEVTSSGDVYAGAWEAASSDRSPWVGVQFEALREVYGIITQGRAGDMLKEWVTAYTFNYSTDCVTWTTFKDKTSPKGKVFIANVDMNGKTTHIFNRVLSIRCARLMPTAWSGSTSMRFDLIGCLNHRENVALLKMTYQSSTAANGLSWLAVDGFTYPNYHRGSCTHTQREMSPWWVVDLGHIYTVTDVEITNRGDCCGERLSNLAIKIGFEFSKMRLDTRNYVLCAEVAGPVAGGATLSAYCQTPTVGRFVFIQLQENQPLTLCEVKVFTTGDNVTNIARGKPTFQSSVSSHGVPSRAVDGNTSPYYLAHGSCSHTAQQPRPRWAVDLQDEYHVQRILITNRGDCCAARLHDVMIHVTHYYSTNSELSTSELCAQVEGPFQLGETRHVHCSQDVVGRYVIISLPGNEEILTLCEVQVYGVRVPTHTYGGAGGRAGCTFPFTYNSTTYTSCTSVNADRPWCAVSTEYETDGLWAYCLDVRLADGRSANDGRVEVQRNGVWGSVCDDGWDDTDAAVLCRQLGYFGGRAVYPPTYQQGTGHILLDGVNCAGNESALFECAATNQHDCGHNEDAGALCWRDPEALQTDYNIGYPAIARTNSDHWSGGTVLVQTTGSVTRPSQIVSWTFYLRKPGNVTLQVWRPTFESRTFVFVKSVKILRYAAGKHTVVDATNVLPGDVIGITFSGTNLVPYDNSAYCEQHMTLYRHSRPAVDYAKPGAAFEFTTKSREADSCRVYSLNVNLKAKANPSSLGDFSFGDSVYKVLSDPLNNREAASQCTLQLGRWAGLARIDSRWEYAHVRQELLAMQQTGTYWVAGRLDDVTEDESGVFDWGHCQPDPSKQCLAVSSSQQSESRELTLLWYTHLCTEKLKFICEKNETKSTKSTKSDVGPKIGKATSANDNSHVARTTMIVLGITVLNILLLVVATFMYRRWRRQQGACVLSQRLRQHRSSSPIIPASTGIGNPMFDDQPPADDAFGFDAGRKNPMYSSDEEM